MIRLAVDDGVAAADAALPEAGARVMASEDLQNGARTLLDKGPATPPSRAAEHSARAAASQSSLIWGRGCGESSSTTPMWRPATLRVIT